MRWIKTPEERSDTLENPSVSLAAMLSGGQRSITGRTINAQTAMGLAAFWNGVSIIAGDVASVPLNVYRKVGRSRELETGHPVYDLIHTMPTEMLSSVAWREASQGHLLLRGNAYSAFDVDGGGNVTDIVPLDPTKVTRKGSNYIWQSDGARETFPAENVIHIPGVGGNGIDGWSVLKMARDSLGLSTGLEESNARLIANASRPSGLLTTPNKLTPEAATALGK